MLFLDFIKQEHQEFSYYPIFMAAASGILNGALAVIIIYAAQHAQPHELNFRYLLMFAVALLAFWVSKRYTLNYNTIQVEQALEKVRMRIADKIRKTNLKSFEDIGKGRLYSALNTDLLTLSQYTPFIINASGSLVMIVFALGFILFVSFTAFILAVAVTLVSLVYFYTKQRKLNAKLQETTQKQNEYFDTLSDLLDGFKELKINTLKSNCFYNQRLRPLSSSMESLKIETGLTFNHLNVFTQSFSFILMASIIFIIPTLTPENTKIIPQVAAILLFVIGPLSEIVGVMPLIARSNAAVQNICSVESDLDTYRSNEANKIDNFTRQATDQKINFSEICCQDIQFTYYNQQQIPGFHVGPINFSIKRGETVFIIGGNGSGKSTFLKLLTTLYQPASGQLLLDGRRIHDNILLQYRDLFSVIFSDFHLFKELYGITHIDQQRVADLLEIMQLAERCQITNDRISDLNLSTGQMKRMALIVALLEDKPIYIFDEWAADQDPDFRRYFYNTIIPQMKEQGKTIIAATHDDHYFHVADRIIKLDAGMLVESNR